MPPSTSHDKHPLIEGPWLTPALLTLLALAVRLAVSPWWWELPLWGDELYYWRMARDLSQFNFFRPPLWGCVLSVVGALTSNPAYGRLLTTLLGTAMAPIVYGLALRLFSRRAAVVAAVLCALYPDYVGYSHYLWSETFFSLICLTAAWLLVDALGEEVRPRALYLLSSFLGLACLAKEYAFLVFASLMLTVVGARFERKKIVLCRAIVSFLVPVLAYSLIASLRNDRVIFLADAPFSNAAEIAHGRAAKRMPVEKRQRLLKKDLEQRLTNLPRIYSEQLANLWTPNSFVAYRLAGRKIDVRAGDNRETVPAVVGAKHGVYGVAHPLLLARGVAAANILVILAGFTGLLVARRSRFKTYALWNLAVLSLSPLVFLMCSRFRLSFMHFLIIYAAAFLADPGTVVRRPIRPLAWVLWGASAIALAVIAVNKWPTIGRWG